MELPTTNLAVDCEEKSIAPIKSVAEGFTGTLYTKTLFKYGDKLEALLPESVELGRSFVPPRYWTSRGLDLLWQGIGRYLTAHPQIRYIFGAVSIANELPELAKQQIVARYQYHFQPVDWQDYAQAHGPFVCDRAIFESQRVPMCVTSKA